MRIVSAVAKFARCQGQGLEWPMRWVGVGKRREWGVDQQAKQRQVGIHEQCRAGLIR